MLLETCYTILDPNNRNLDLQDIITKVTKDRWEKRCDGLTYIVDMKPAILLPNIFKKLNELGLIDGNTGKPFKITKKNNSSFDFKSIIKMLLIVFLLCAILNIFLKYLFKRHKSFFT
jgi:hypothetical protein